MQEIYYLAFEPQIPIQYNKILLLMILHHIIFISYLYDLSICTSCLTVPGPFAAKAQTDYLLGNRAADT